MRWFSPGLKYNAGMTGLLKRLIGQGLAVAEPAAGPPAADLHRADRWTWAKVQLGALERRDARALDWDNLIKAVQELQQDMASGLREFGGLIVEHMIKIEEARDANSFLGWEDTYLLHRKHAITEIKLWPGLADDLGPILQSGWERGRADAIEALGRYEMEGREDDAAARLARDARVAELEDAIPEECPWTVSEILGCDPRRGELKSSKTVIPKVIRERLCGEGVVVKYSDGRPLNDKKIEVLVGRARERGGRWEGLGPEVEADKDSADQSTSMVELARKSQQRGGSRGSGRGR